MGVEQHDVVGRCVELRRGRAVKAGGLRTPGEFPRQGFGAVVEVGVEGGWDGGAVPGLAHLPPELRIGDGRAGNEPALVALAAQLLRQTDGRFRAGPHPDQIGRLAKELRDLGRKSNAWVWKVTLSFTSVPDFFMTPGNTFSPMTLEMMSSVA